MSRQPSVYLAGTNVSGANTEEVLKSQTKICERYNIVAIHSMENNAIQTSKTIYDGNIDKMLEADIICANMNSFNDNQADNGTCFEAGFFAGFNEALRAMGMAIPLKPLYGYTDSPKKINPMIESPMKDTGALITTGFEDCIAKIAEDFKQKKIKIVD